MFKKALFLFLLVSFVSTSLGQSKIKFTKEEQDWLNSHPSIVFGYEPNWPPFEIYEEGRFTGIIGDYIGIIEDETGIEMIPGPPKQWKETLDAFYNNELKLLVSVGVSRRDTTKFAFTKPYLKDPLVIVSRVNSKEINDFTDITTETIAVPKGYNRIGLLNRECPHAKLIQLKNVKECLAKIDDREADIFIGSLGAVTYYVNESGYKNLRIAAPRNVDIIRLCFGVTKEWEVFRNIIQKVIDSLSEEDHYRIKARWSVLRHEEGIKKSDFKNYLYIWASVLVIAMLLFYLWNKTLRKQIRIRLAAEKSLQQSLDLIQEKNTEKELLLKEIHHRVKNNLQIVYSMLNMQSRKVKNSEALRIIAEGKSRVMAMSLIHKVIYESENLDKVNLNSYIKSLVNNINKVYKTDKDIELQVETNEILLDLEKAIPMGLILNELLTNSYKYAFKYVDKGLIIITFIQNVSEIHFHFKDDGCGFSVDQIEEFESLGLRLVKRLANQLNSEAEIRSDKGVEVDIQFNIK